MDDRAKVFLGALLGAAVGGAAGFLFLTERGRAVRAEVGPRLDDLLHEARRLQGSVRSLRESAKEGWGTVRDFAADLTEDAAAWAEHGPEVPHH